MPSTQVSPPPLSPPPSWTTTRCHALQDTCALIQASFAAFLCLSRGESIRRTLPCGCTLVCLLIAATWCRSLPDEPFYLVTFGVPVSGLSPASITVAAGPLATVVVSAVPWGSNGNGRRLGSNPAASEWRVDVNVTGNYQRAPIAIGLAHDVTTPNNAGVQPVATEGAAHVVLYEPVLPDATPGEELQKQGETSVVVQRTKSPVLDVVVDFGARVSGVAVRNFRLESSTATAVSMTVAPVDGAGTRDDPARYWRLVLTVQSSVPSSRLQVYLNNDDDNIYPPPAQRSEPVLDAEYAGETDLIGWLAMLAICTAAVACCVGCGLYFVSRHCKKRNAAKAAPYQPEPASQGGSANNPHAQWSPQQRQHQQQQPLPGTGSWMQQQRVQGGGAIMVPMNHQGQPAPRGGTLPPLKR